MTEEKRNALLRGFRVDAEEGNRATFRRMSKCERFKVGRQWDEDVLNRAKAKRKFTLTINRILPTVLQVTGTEVQNPRDIKVKNTKGGTRVMAQLLTALAKFTLDTSHAHRKKSHMFEDGTTTARGWIGAEIDYSKDPANGDIVIEKYDPFMVLVDPNRKQYDLNAAAGGAKYVIIDKWEDKAKIEALYPGKKNDLMNVNYTAHESSGWFSSIVNFMFDRTEPGGVGDDYRDQLKEEDSTGSTMAKYNYRISKVLWKEWKKGLYIQRLDDPLSFIACTKPKDIKAARQIAADKPDEVRLIDKDRRGRPLTIAVLNKTIMCGDKELEHIEDPYKGMNKFLIIPYSPYFVNGYEFGLVENLIGPQEQVNWSWSMELNLLKQLANVGWKVKLAMGRMKQWLEEHGSEDGIVIEEGKFGGKVEKLELNQFPAGLDVITEKGSRHISEISNVRLESPQTDKDRVAAAIRLKQASAFTGSATMFANFDYSMELLGDLVIALIRNMGTFSEDEIRAIVDEEDLVDIKMLNEAKQMIIGQLQKLGAGLPDQPKQPTNDLYADQVPGVYGQMMANMNNMSMALWQQDVDMTGALMQKIEAAARPIAVDMLLAEMKNIGRGRYGIKVTLAPMAETMRHIKALETVELNKMLLESNHIPISRRRLIEAMDPPNKEAIIEEEAQQMAQLQARQE